MFRQKWYKMSYRLGKWRIIHFMAGNFSKKQHAFRSFSQDLRADDFPPVLFMYGPEEYLIDWAAGSLAKRYVNPGAAAIDYMKLFDDCSAAEITEAAGTFSMFSEKKVVWVKSYMPLTAVNPRGYTASDRDKILDYIKNPNEQTILIFSAEAPEERSELVKELKKNCKTYFFDKLDYSELAAFAENRFRAEDVFISRETLKYLLDETGYFNKETEYRLFNLVNDIKKIAAYSDGQKITEEDISATLSGDMDTFVFNFLDAVSSNRKDLAFELLHNMLASGNEVFNMIGILVNHFELLLGVKEFREDGLGASAITSKLKVHEFRVKKAMAFADKFTVERLRSILSQLYETDRNIKTGALEPNLALELLVGRI